MTDILILKERIKNSILVGESDFREFKSAWEGKPGNKKPRLVKHICEDIAEGLVAFANSDGGELIIGIEDDTTITGVPHDAEDVETMLNAVRSHVFKGQQLPLTFALKTEVDGHAILFFQVDKGTDEIYQLPDGRVMTRSGNRTMPARVRALQFDRREKESRQYDREWSDGATLGDLDIDLIRSLGSKFMSALSLSVEKFLQQMGLADYTAGGLRLRAAALLLFANDIQKWHPRCQVRFMRVAGTALLSGASFNVVSEEIAEGNILELIEDAQKKLEKYIVESNGLNTDGRFEPRYSYPVAACREALVNAVFHRDYTIASAIEVYFFDDRMEVRSPGALLSTLNVDDLYANENRHDSRNVRIAQVLKTLQIVRESGEGVRRILNDADAGGYPRPMLYSNTNWFSITLFKK
ncbi:MAG: ATP-binding protein [Saprospiraceae bacterium]